MYAIVRIFTIGIGALLVTLGALRWRFYCRRCPLSAKRTADLVLDCLLSSRSRTLILYRALSLVLFASCPLPASIQGIRVLGVMCAVAALVDLLLPPTYLVLGHSISTAADLLPEVARASLLARTCHFFGHPRQPGDPRGGPLHCLGFALFRRGFSLRTTGDDWGRQLSHALTLARLLVIDVRSYPNRETVTDDVYCEIDLALRIKPRQIVLFGETDSPVIHLLAKANPPLEWIPNLTGLSDRIRKITADVPVESIAEIRKKFEGWPN